MYKCKKCNAEFEEPHTRTEVETVYSHGEKQIYYNYNECPDCGSEDFEEYYGEDEIEENEEEEEDENI